MQCNQNAEFLTVKPGGRRLVGQNLVTIVRRILPKRELFLYLTCLLISTEQSVQWLAYGLNDPEFESLQWQEIFYLRQIVQISSVSHWVSFSINTGILSLAVKWPGRETDHLPPSNTGVSNG